MQDLFEQLKESLTDLDPIAWIQNHLMLDGAPFRLNQGYKAFNDIYRYIGMKALEKNSKPIVLVKGRQVGATTMCSALELYFCASKLFGTNGKPPMRIMHCFPQQEMANKYTKTKLNTMITTAVAGDGQKSRPGQKSFVELRLDNTNPANNNISFKQFEGGSHIFIEYSGVDGGRLRGATFDCVFFDEIQDYMKGAVTFGNVNKSLSKAQYGSEGEGIQVYFGTPKQKNSDYWRIWNNASQHYFYLGCEKCKEYFPLYEPGSDSWEKTWIREYIVECRHCQHQQDKRMAADRGKWINLSKEIDPKYIGYHINQLYMPNFTKEKILSEKPSNNSNTTERTYQNEVLGEFYSGECAPITIEEIDANCADYKRTFVSGITYTDGKKAYLGCDWGKKANIHNLDDTKGDDKKPGGSSYSCTAVLVPEGNILSLVFANRLEKTDLEYKKNVIEKMYRQYAITLGMGDIGYGEGICELLQKELGDKFLATNAVGKINGRARFSDDMTPKTLIFERDYYLEELFTFMKEGRIKFPFGEYEQIGWLLNHITMGIEIKNSTNKFGDVTRKYVKSGIPCDGLMALLNAYMAYKFDISRGFKITDPNQMETGAKTKKPSVVLAFAPRNGRYR